MNNTAHVTVEGLPVGCYPWWIPGKKYEIVIQDGELGVFSEDGDFYTLDGRKLARGVYFKGVPSWAEGELPPLGEVCEINTSRGWLECTIVYQNGDYAIAHINDENRFGMKCDWSRKGFRPLKTAEEIALEQLAFVMFSCDTAGNISSKEAARAVYHAIKSGEIEGVGLEVC